MVLGWIGLERSNEQGEHSHQPLSACVQSTPQHQLTDMVKQMEATKEDARQAVEAGRSAVLKANIERDEARKAQAAAEANAVKLQNEIEQMKADFKKAELELNDVIMARDEDLSRTSDELGRIMLENERLARIQAQHDDVCSYLSPASCPFHPPSPASCTPFTDDSHSLTALQHNVCRC